MNDQELKQVDIYTDGGCISNPGGNGGYGVVLLYNNKRKELSGGYANTTNNRMELMAANNDYTSDIVRVKLDDTWVEVHKVGRGPCDNPNLERIQ